MAVAAEFIAAPRVNRSATQDRHRSRARDRVAPAIPARSRARLSHPQSRKRHALRRRSATHSPRHADRRPVSPASFTCSTSRASVCINATTPVSSSRCDGCAIWGIPSSWSSTMRKRFAPPITSSISGRAPVRAAARSWREGTLAEVLHAKNSPTADYLSGRARIEIPKRRVAPRTPVGFIGRLAHRARREREQSAKRHRGVSARLFHLRDRRLRQRQIDPRR